MSALSNKKVNANKWGQRINEVRVELNVKCCLLYCRCADSTQKGLNAQPPLESPGAAIQT